MTVQPAFHRDKLQRTYAKWARFYDLVYTGLFAPAQALAAQRAAEAGKIILEIGVGTGLVLSYYPQDRIVTGVDLSHAMLKQAQKKIGGPRMPDVAGLSVMDATRLALPPENFDAVTFPFVLPLIPDPEKALDEAARVLKIGGRIVITSRFGAEGGLRAKIETTVEPFVARMGWSSAFKASRILNWAARKGNMRFLEDRKTFFFRVITLEKTGA